MSRYNNCPGCRQERMHAQGARFRRSAEHTCKGTTALSIPDEAKRLNTKEEYDAAKEKYDLLSAIVEPSYDSQQIMKTLAIRIEQFEQHRDALLKQMEVNRSGYGGMLPTGQLVDRREHPDAMPLQANSLFGTPPPKQIESAV